MDHDEKDPLRGTPDIYNCSICDDEFTEGYEYPEKVLVCCRCNHFEVIASHYIKILRDKSGHITATPGQIIDLATDRKYIYQ